MGNESDLPTLPSTATSGDEAEDSHYGRFVSLGVIGQGGMGVVLRAHDPDLDRNVAIKVLAPQLFGAYDATSEQRLQREAQAMAKLSHPNVVHVYEMGRAGSSHFIAMELVEGSTLRRWLLDRSRSWRDVVAAFIACGRGLEAAHDAGLVHRDFKPENVLIGADQRPRVTDFGLVATGVSFDSADLGDVSLAGGLTVRGAVIGTPMYMSPEQWRSADVDARTDQFAFCIALWEGVYGERPFAGRTSVEVRENVLAGKVRDTPDTKDAKRIPGWLEAALRRGLSVNRDERWPSMTALLAELDRPRGRRWPWVVGAAGVLGVGAVGAALVLGASAGPDPCPDPRARALAVWSPTVRQRIEAAFVASKVAYAPNTLARTLPRFDDETGRWRAIHVDACKANRAGRESDTLLDQRMRCLDLWLRELDGTASLLAAVTDRTSVDLAIGAAQALSQVSDCADMERLRSTPPPPPEKRVEADAIIDELQAVGLERLAGRLEPLLSRTAELVARARTLDHPPTLTAALLERWRVLHAMRDHVTGKATLEDLAQTAARAGQDTASAHAWVSLVLLVGSDLEQPDDAKQLVPVARAAVARAGDPLELRIRLLVNEASVIDGNGEAARALVLLAEAHELLTAAGAEKGPPSNELGNLLLEVNVAIGSAQGSAGNYEASAAAFQEAIAGARRAFGDEHPRLVPMLANLGETFRRDDKSTESLAAYEEAARIAERSMGETPILVKLWNRIGGLHFQLGQLDEAIARFDRTLALAERLLPPDDKVILSVVTDRALTLSELGRRDEALAAYDRVIAAYERTKAPAKTMHTAVHNRAGTLRELERWDEAIAGFQQALRMYDDLPGLEHDRVETLVGLGLTYVRAHRPAEAIAPLERARDNQAEGRNLELQRSGRWLLGRARVESRRDVARGLAEVRAVRAELVAAGDDPQAKEELAEIDTWLAKHAK